MLPQGIEVKWDQRERCVVACQCLCCSHSTAAVSSVIFPAFSRDLILTVNGILRMGPSAEVIYIVTLLAYGPKMEIMYCVWLLAYGPTSQDIY